MADSESETQCLICHQEIEEKNKTRIGDKAIESLIKASKEIGDKKYLKMQNLAFLNVHRNCQISYVTPGRIKKEKKAISEKILKTKRENKKARKFDFRSCCLFCGLDAITDTHKKPVRLVSNDNVKENILQALDTRKDDDFNTKLRLRLEFASNLSEIEARYHAKCMQQFYLPKSSVGILGRPMSENMSTIVQHVINHILQNSEDSQFSLKEMIENFRDNLPRIDRIKHHLKNYFGNDIVMYDVPNDTIICFVEKKRKTLNDDWYREKASTNEQERIRIVEMAAHIILEDIRVVRYDTNNYNAPSSFLHDVNKNVPNSLKIFLDTLIKSNKRSEYAQQNKWSKRVSTIAHILISCVRPRTFLSSVLLGLSTFIHKKYSAKGLIDTLSYLGLCASYHETQLFESSIVNDPEQFKNTLFQEILQEEEAEESQSEVNADPKRRRIT